MKEVLVTLLVLSAIGCLQGRKGYGPGEQEWGWIDVSSSAHMFYWLFYVQAPEVTTFTDRPLVIWLQGGPGASSTGYGNFAELGPLFINGTARPSSWANHVNLMFIDNPVGSGFSYVDRNSALNTNNEQIGANMVNFIVEFYNQYPDFSKTPLYIFCESYGGKMVVEIAKQLKAAIKNQGLNIDFKGVGLGDSWISPIDSVNTWGPFLLHTSVVDKRGHDTIVAGAKAVQEALDNGQFEDATDLWGYLEGTVINEASNVDFYNILYKVSGNFKNRRAMRSPREFLYRQHVFDNTRDDDADIQALMEGPVKKALGLPQDIVHGAQGGAVFNALYGDFMKPVTSVVEELLNNTDLQVAVFSGQLDLIVDTLGTLQWVDRLNWKGSAAWKTASRRPLVINGYIEGYVKNVNNLYFYWIDRAGHMVPTDNPDAAIELLRRVTQFGKK